MVAFKKICLFPARLQPYHNCHRTTLLAHAAMGRKVIIVIGSTQESWTKENPFTYEERKTMIAQALIADNIEPVIYGIPDFHNGPRWTAAILEASGFSKDEVVVSSRNQWTLDVCLEAGIETVVHPPCKGLNGTSVRRRIAEERDWEAHVPKTIARYLKTVKTNAPGTLKSAPKYGLTGVQRIRALEMGLI